ncbi:MAG TPA: HlyD family type I secretion periplasmic adaptor subunit [Reyranella sp.]|jgi:HlyD family type I secretion membrane fusion protein|nr:HlyD family type I secretion periplasmic adaptor subunit [Reyranella sp.]
MTTAPALRVVQMPSVASVRPFRPPTREGDEEPRASDAAARYLLTGLAIVAIFFGGFGTWAVTAPLNSAVVALGVVKTEGNRKSVQHLEGGIVNELRIKEGSVVRAGDILIVLDDSQARAEYEVYTKQYVVLRASEVRLLAELAGNNALLMPQELAAHNNDPYVQDIWGGQIKQFAARRDAIEGQRSVIREKVNQLASQIVGAEGQVKWFSEQLASVQKEAESIAPLVEKNLLPRPRLLQLERAAFGLEGQIADARASIAKFKQAQSEQQLQIAQLDNDRMAEITRDLRDTQAKVLEVIPKRINAEVVLSRVDIRSPYAGKVVGLAVFSKGAVIQRGEKIMDIVPDEEELTIEAQVPVDDISDVRPAMKADVHLIAYKQRIVPVIAGEVIHVSADRLVDQKSNQPYFIALVRLDEAELAKLPEVKLYPGMPATVIIPTEARTAFDYILGPLVMSFNKAFRQR